MPARDMFFLAARATRTGAGVVAERPDARAASSGVRGGWKSDWSAGRGARR